MDIESKILNKLLKNKSRVIIEGLPFKPANYFHCAQKDNREYAKSRLDYMKQYYLDLLETTDFFPFSNDLFKRFYTYGMICSLRGEILTDSCYLWNPNFGSDIPIKLDLSSTPEYSLFNGQIVAIKCTNTKKSELTVEKIYHLPTLNVNRSTKLSLKIMIYKGPFNEDFLKEIFDQDPELLVLFGPFESDSTEHFNIFDEFVESIRNHLKRNMYTKIIFVPSLEDYNFINVFPQPGIFIDSERIFCISNPGSYTINGHSIVFSNIDILNSIALNEINKIEHLNKNSIVSEDLHHRISQNLIFQMSHIPIFPFQQNISYGPWLNMDFAPNLYITCSNLERFFRSVGPTTVLNIGVSNKNGLLLKYDALKDKYIFNFIN